MDELEPKPAKICRDSASHREGVGEVLRQDLQMFPGYPVFDVSRRAFWRAISGSRGAVSKGLPKQLEYRVTQRWLAGIQKSLFNLRSQPSKALRVEIADPDRWLRRIHRLLIRFRAVLETGDNLETAFWLDSDLLPRRRVTRLSTLRLEFPLVWRAAERLLWVSFSSPQGVPSDLEDWLEQNAPQIGAVVAAGAEQDLESIQAAICFLFHLRKTAPARFGEGLLRHLADSATWQFELNPRLTNRSIYLAFRNDAPCATSIRKCLFRLNRRHGQVANSKRVTSLGTRLANLPSQLFRCSPADQTAIAELLASLLENGFPFQGAAHFIHWLKRIQGTDDSFCRTLDKKRFAQEFLKEAGVHHGRDYFGIHELANLVEEVLVKQIPGDSATNWKSLLDVLPAEFGLERWRFVALSMCRHSSGDDSLFELSELAGIIRDHGFPSKELERVKDTGHQLYYADSLVDDFLWFRRMYPESDVGALFTHFFRCSGQRPTFDWLDSYCRSQRAFPSASDCIKCLSTLDLELDIVSLAKKVARLTVEPDRFAAIFQTCSKDDSRLQALAYLAQSYASDVPWNLAIRCAVNGKRKLLFRWSNTVRIRRALNLSLPAFIGYDSDKAWIQSYPRAFHSVLGRLADIRTDAERIAAKKLDVLFPSPARLLTERDELVRKLRDCHGGSHQPSLMRRIQKLDLQLNGRHQPSQKYVAKAIDKLGQLADMWAVQKSCEEACHGLLPELARLSGCANVSRNILAEPWFEVLASVLETAPKAREIGLSVLTRRLAGMPCDVLNHPRNQIFLEGLARRGIILRPWLDQSIAVRGTSKSGEDYFVQFTEDILELFLMGYHFKTCLSPGRPNFVSTISVISDANKRVAYGKTARGRIIGRRLFALTDDGHVIGFRAYSHDPEDGFEQVSAGFASKLAEAMHAVLTADGHVSSLTVGNWHEDSACQLH